MVSQVGEGGSLPLLHARQPLSFSSRQFLPRCESASPHSCFLFSGYPVCQTCWKLWTFSILLNRWKLFINQHLLFCSPSYFACLQDVGAVYAVLYWDQISGSWQALVYFAQSQPGPSPAVLLMSSQALCAAVQAVQPAQTSHRQENFSEKIL